MQLPPSSVNRSDLAFTLIELAIVLVIIGLIVGGVLVGQDLIKAAQVRATITQIEKYNSAVNTFRGKYGALPGDMNAATATQFGFAPRGSNSGQGDGNGIIAGLYGGQACNFCGTGGEVVVFWEDLTTANGLNVNMIDGAFNTASISNTPGSAVTGSNIGLYLPQAKIGNGNYVYVWAGGPGENTNYPYGDSQNYFGLSAVTTLASPRDWGLYSNPGLTVRQAYAIDSKIDDGLPQSGTVEAVYINSYANGPPWSPNAASASSATCFDTTSYQYSVQISNGSNVNCALSFRFQ